MPCDSLCNSGRRFVFSRCWGIFDFEDKRISDLGVDLFSPIFIIISLSEYTTSPLFVQAGQLIFLAFVLVVFILGAQVWFCVTKNILLPLTPKILQWLQPQDASTEHSAAQGGSDVAYCRARELDSTGLSDLLRQAPSNLVDLPGNHSRLQKVANISVGKTDSSFSFAGLVVYNATGEDVIVAIYKASFDNRKALTTLYGDWVRSSYLDILNRTLQEQRAVQSVSIVAQSEHRDLAHIIANETASSLPSLVSHPARYVIQLIILGNPSVSPLERQHQQLGVVLYDFTTTAPTAEGSDQKRWGFNKFWKAMCGRLAG